MAATPALSNERLSFLTVKGLEQNAFWKHKRAMIAAWVDVRLVDAWYAYAKTKPVLGLKEKDEDAIARGIILEGQAIVANPKFLSSQGGTDDVTLSLLDMAKQLNHHFGDEYKAKGIAFFPESKYFTHEELNSASESVSQCITNAQPFSAKEYDRLLENRTLTTSKLERLLAGLDAASLSSNGVIVVRGGGSGSVVSQKDKNAANIRKKMPKKAGATTTEYYIPAGGPIASKEYVERDDLCGFEERTITTIQPTTKCERTNDVGILQCSVVPQTRVKKELIPVACETTYNALQTGLVVNIDDETGRITTKKQIAEQVLGKVKRQVPGSQAIPYQPMRKMDEKDAKQPEASDKAKALISNMYGKSTDGTTGPSASSLEAMAKRALSAKLGGSGIPTKKRGAPPAKIAGANGSYFTNAVPGIERDVSVSRDRFKLNSQDMVYRSLLGNGARAMMGLERLIMVNGDSTIVGANPTAANALVTYLREDTSLEALQNRTRGEGYTFPHKYLPYGRLDPAHRAYSDWLYARNELMRLLYPKYQFPIPSPMMSIAQLEGHLLTTFAVLQTYSEEIPYLRILEGLPSEIGDRMEDVVHKAFQALIKIGREQKEHGMPQPVDITERLSEVAFMPDTKQEVKIDYNAARLGGAIPPAQRVVIIEDLRQEDKEEKKKTKIKNEVPKDEIYLAAGLDTAVVGQEWTEPEKVAGSDNTFYVDEQFAIKTLQELYAEISQQVKSVPNALTNLLDGNKEGKYDVLPVQQPPTSEIRHNNNNRGMASVNLLTLLQEVQLFGYAINSNAAPFKASVEKLRKPTVQRFVNHHIIAYLTLYQSFQTERFFYLAQLRKKLLDEPGSTPFSISPKISRNFVTIGGWMAYLPHSKDASATPQKSKSKRNKK